MMYKLIKRDNKPDLLLVPMADCQTTTALVMFATGSRDENKKNNGISHFLEHMFFKGTTKRPNTLDISATLDGVGAEFNAFTTKEYTGYWVKSAAEHLELSLDVLSDILLNSKFDSKEIEREKGVIIEEINMYNDNPMWYMEDLFEELLYGDTPAGWNTAGTKENVASFQRADFIDYYQKQYGIGSACIVIAGAVPEKIETLVDGYFEKMTPAKPVNKDITVDQQTTPALKLFFKETDQAHLSLGVRTWGYANQNEYALKLLSLILGGSMSSRLFINLRERNGLCYYVRASGETHTDTGYLTTRAGVKVENIEKAVQIILVEYKKLVDELVTAEELTRVKNFIHGKISLSLEGSDDLAEWFANQAIILKQLATNRRGILTPEELLTEIDKITAEDIQRVAKEIFIEKNLNLAVIGPYKDEAKFKNLLKF